ncbi:MAG: hypothetical protein KA275_05735 [Chitinophagaceae bacterium]|nr:hypothetical protein [Chitinophagaceae bacterium]
MKKTFISILATSFFLFSCSNQQSNDPKIISENYLNAIQQYDFERAIEMADDHTKESLTIAMNALKDSTGKDLDLPKTESKIKISSQTKLSEDSFLVNYIDEMAPTFPQKLYVIKDKKQHWKVHSFIID